MLWDHLTANLYLEGDKSQNIWQYPAVVNSLVEQEATVGVKDWSGIFMLTDVWVNQNGKWQVVSRQGTGPLARQ
jgi:hypothetical protein